MREKTAIWLLITFGIALNVIMLGYFYLDDNDIINADKIGLKVGVLFYICLVAHGVFAFLSIAGIVFYKKKTWFFVSLALHLWLPIYMFLVGP